MNLFEPRTSIDPEKSEQIRRWVSARLDLAEDVVILVSELRCTEPGCPPLETVIALLEGPGSRRQFKIHKSAAEISEEDIEALAADCK